MAQDLPSNQAQPRVSRRALLKGAAQGGALCALTSLAAAAGAVSGCAALPPTTPTPTPPTATPAPTPTRPAVSGGPGAKIEMDMLAHWIEQRFSSGANLPFSFVLGGMPSAELLKTWRMSSSNQEIDDQRSQRTLTFANPNTGLALDCVITVYKHDPAVEWVLHFRNDGASDSPILENVLALDTPLQAAALQSAVPSAPPRLYYADGSTAVITDFQPHETDLKPGTEMRFAPQGGRSSDGVMPFFNLALPGGDTGAVVAVGWTGQWTGAFTAHDDGSVRVTAGMARTHLTLHPGEEIRTPSILLVFWAGDRLRGHNLLRSVLRKHYSPMPGGKPAVLPIAASGASIGFNVVTEENQIQAIETIARRKLPIDTYWIDAGWSTGGFPEGMGTWDPAPDRFPKGLGPVGAAAHKAGLRFLVWFEPERVMPRTWLREQHSEWLLNPVDLPPDLAYQKDWGLLDLGNPEAWAWARETFSAMVGDFGVDIYRHDFNMHPLYYWQADEAEDRQGIREIRYITGLYAYFDALAQDHPGLLLDNSASGGRRLDVEMLRRLVPLLRSDYFWDPVGDQSMEYALSFWLPLHGQGANNTSTYPFRSGMGTHMSLPFDFYYGRIGFEYAWTELGQRLDEYVSIRPMFEGDFYPLTPYSAAADAWIAWQFDRPDLGQGIVLAFRRGGSDTALTVKLHGLEPDARYVVTDRNTGKTNEMPGAEMMAQGLALDLPEAPGSALITYRRGQKGQARQALPQLA
jgi:alpha-galactosidase